MTFRFPPALFTAAIVVVGVGVSPRIAGAQQDTTIVTRADSMRRETTLDAMTVTATRTRTSLRNTPANASVLSGDALQTTSAVSVPGVLQALPGFSLVNYGHPLTTRAERSAAVFRGLAGTSASRALVLLDGIPVNDPFNGWVRWSRIPLPLVDRVEVVRGGGSMAWGSRALSGVVNLVTVVPNGTQFDAVVEGGGLGTTRSAASAAVRTDKLDVLLAGDYLDTDGFLLLREDQAGPVDLPRGVQTRVGFAKLRYRATPNLTVHLGANYLDDRNRGETAATQRTATTGEVRGGLDWALPDGSALTMLAYRTDRTAFFTLPAVATDRKTESPRRATRLPSSAVGGTLQWGKRVNNHHDVSVGVDVSTVDGEYRDQHTMVAGAFTRERYSGGEQRSVGVFVQDGIDLGERTRVQLGTRIDRIGDLRGRRGELVLATGATLSDSIYPATGRTAVTFTAGATHRVSSQVQLRTSTYRAFRNATLNELHTPFYVGNFGTNIIEANATLAPETLIGAEAGADLEFGNAWLVRLTGFWNRVSDPIVEFTVGTASTAGEVVAPCGPLTRNGVCRQRRNVGALRSVGLESEVDWRPSEQLGFGLAYAFNPTRIISPVASVNGATPRGATRDAVTGRARWMHPRVATTELEVRHVGVRYDDDINSIELKPFTVVGATVQRPLTHRITAYVRVENLLDEVYEISRGTNGIAEVGGPRWVMVGVRSRW